MKRLVLLFAAVALIVAAGASAAVFKQNAGVDPLVHGQVVGLNFETTIDPGSLPPNTAYNEWCTYFEGQSHKAKQQVFSVSSDAAGGLTSAHPVAVLTGGLTLPGTLECDFTVPGSLGTLGELAVLSNGGDAAVWGKLK